MIDFRYSLVGKPLDVLLRAARIVFGDLLLFHQLAHVRNRIAADVANRDPGLLRLVLGLSRQVTSAKTRL